MYTVPKLDDYSPAALEKAFGDLAVKLRDDSVHVQDETEWKDFRDRWMSRKHGFLTQVRENWLKQAPPNAKKEVGLQFNRLHSQVQPFVTDYLSFLSHRRVLAAPPAEERTLQQTKAEVSEARLQADRLDITLPGIRRPIGAEHPVIRALNEIVSVLRRWTTR